jgi:uncharacterized protein (DUF2141 family)
MSRISIAVLITTVMLLTPIFAQAQLAKLTVTVNGLNPTTGSVEVSVFNAEETFMQSPFLQQSQAVDENEQLEFEFAGLLDGDYAIVVVHDENDNGLLDTGFLGFGGESFAYSNDATSFLGRPSFESAKVSVGETDLTIEINLD